MGFDLARFQQAQFTPRTAEVEVPALADFFAPGERPVFVVRGLSFDELARADNSADRSEVYRRLIAGLASGASGETVAALQEALGMGSAVPAQAIKRHEFLVAASVEPRINLETSVKLAETWPVEFKILTDRIVELTGLGKICAAPINSGPMPASEPA